MKIIGNSNSRVQEESFIGVHPRACVYVLSMAVFPLRGQNRVVVIENVWPVKPKIFAIWYVMGKVCDPWPKGLK